MAETSGSLQIDKSRRERLLELYWLEKYLFEDVHEKFEGGKPIDDFDFYCIIYWKRNASKTRIKEGLAKLGKTPGELLEQVRKAARPEDKFAVLTKVNGISIAIASAILAVCYPERYTVVDSYILRMLAEEGYLSDDSMTPQRYFEYNELCKRLGDAWGKSLRDVDRILWTKAWKERVVPSKRGGEESRGEAKVTGSETTAHADREWIHRCVSLLEECTALTDEMEQRLIPSVEHEAYSQAAEEARIRADGILGKWRALPMPQDSRFIEAHRLFEGALVDLVASFAEICAACDAVDEEKAEGHGKKAAALLESYQERFLRATELLRKSKLYPHNPSVQEGGRGLAPPLQVRCL